MSRQITIKIDMAGGVNMDAEGFQGASCTEYTSVFERVLTGEGRKDTKKPEYDEQEPVSAQKQNLRF